MTRNQPDLAGVLGQFSTDRRIDILRRIGTDGSISQAARGAGVSYKAAWQALETLSNLAGTPLVEKAVGGSGGGGAVLTRAGEQVLRAAERLGRSRAQVLSSLGRARAGAAGTADAGAAAAGLAASGLRTSMRNQLPCRVRTLEPTRGLVRVTLALPGGALLRARITRESVQLLALEKGQPVLALFKATAVRIAPQLEPGDTLNLLHGQVIRASRARQGGEVALRLQGGLSIVGFAEEHATLRARMAALAAIDESGVVIGIPA